MDWHTRYMQQARWTRELRDYLFEHTELKNARRVLEAGCGTGAILAEMHAPAVLHGLDIQPAALKETKIHAPTVSLACGDVLSLPYSDASFDITFCHFFLLWVKDPQKALQEMKRVTRTSGHVLALAEPDYSDRVDQPTALARLGRWQTEALWRQGANPSMGGKLAESFFEAGIELVETGAIKNVGNEALPFADWELEWEVLEADLAGFVPDEEIQQMKALDQQARGREERILYVPTYFAWGRV